VVFIFCFVIFVILKQEGNRTIDAEKALGANEALKRRRLLTSYFTFADLPDVLNHSRNHYGPSMRILSPFAQYCKEETPTCNELCAQRAKGIELTSRVCQSVRNVGAPRECWEAELMRCWPEDSNFWDGQVEWTLIAHDLAGDSGIPWIYFKSSQIRLHLFVFGYGTIGTFKDAWNKFKHAHRLIELLIYCGDQAILLSGHNQGAAWAAISNLYLTQRGHSLRSRIVMGSGIPLAEAEFYDDYMQFTTPDETSIFLALGLSVPTRPLLMDVAPIINSPQYASQALPQYGFICRIVDGRSITCVDPQPEYLDFNSTLMQRDINRRSGFNYIHSIHAYRRCFVACINYFDSRSIEFLPNIKRFTLHPPQFSQEHHPLQSGLVRPIPQRGAFADLMKGQ